MRASVLDYSTLKRVFCGIATADRVLRCHDTWAVSHGPTHDVESGDWIASWRSKSPYIHAFDATELPFVALLVARLVYRFVIYA